MCETKFSVSFLDRFFTPSKFSGTFLNKIRCLKIIINILKLIIKIYILIYNGQYLSR